MSAFRAILYFRYNCPALELALRASLTPGRGVWFTGGMTNQQFADAIGCHHSMASRLRAGLRLPSVATMARISREFGIPIETLVAAHEKGAEDFGLLLRQRVFSSKEKAVA